MDSLTQAVLGAGIQGALLGRFHGRKALVAGALLATLPDLDVLIDHGDPISGMINHRGFSHSVFVLTALAALLTWLYRRWRPHPDYGAGRLFLTLWLVLVTHPLLDAFTSYGTQLWWPLRPIPTAWSSIFIIDPFFTVPLTLVVIAALIAGNKPRTGPALGIALGWCALYLAASLGIKGFVEGRVKHQLASEGIHTQAVFSTPEPFNILLWRVVTRTDDDHYVETISSLLDRQPPEHLRLPLNSGLAWAREAGPAASPMAGPAHGEDAGTPGAIQAHRAISPQLAGLQWFTGNWLRYDAIDNHLVVSDLRMGLGTGYYSFRFVIARRNGAGAPWVPETPHYWPRNRGTEQLESVIRRVWQQQPPLPLAQWEALMTSPAH